MASILKNGILLFVLMAGLFPAQGRPILPADSLHTNTVLFKVSHPETDKTSYLFGTHHAFGKSFFDSLNLATEALLASDLLIKENLNIPGHLAEDIINRRAVSTNWSKYLSKEHLVFIETLFSAGRLDVSKMTPAELFAFLNRYYKERICLEKPRTEYRSLDDYIGTLAAEHQLELLGLETTEEQLQLINKDIEGMPRKVHKKRLAAVLANIQAAARGGCAEIDWYRNMNFDFQLEQPCRNSLLLTDRNNRWMAQLQELLPTRNCFIAVGLSHLMFECGLLNQLRAAGYDIVPVEVK